ncbi:hypothetical protein F52700_12166 [Fusarium sp. NRRL 52700]|nr:hypothetical protein F52700_12166 [Fusarium sp. NRRL 52700]
MFRLFVMLFSHLAGICLAQNSSLPKDCSTEIKNINEGILIYNSTRTARTRFSGQDRPWYITAAMTDRRAPGLVFRGVDTSQELSVFISVHRTLADPKNSVGRDTRVCSSILKGVNRTSDNPPDMDAPENTPGLWAGLVGDEDREDFDKYDLRVQQTIPLLFSASGMSRLICIAPDQVVPGSRKPQMKLEGDDGDPEEAENTASRAGGFGAAVFLGVGAIFSLL